MDRRRKAELFEQIRREYEHGVGTIRAVAKRLGIHRRMVRQALADAQPPARKQAERKRPQLGPVRDFIDTILEADQRARASSGTRRIGFTNGFGGRSQRQQFLNRQ